MKIRDLEERKLKELIAKEIKHTLLAIDQRTPEKEAFAIWVNDFCSYLKNNPEIEVSLIGNFFLNIRMGIIDIEKVSLKTLVVGFRSFIFSASKKQNENYLPEDYNKNNDPAISMAVLARMTRPGLKEMPLQEVVKKIKNGEIAI